MKFCPDCGTKIEGMNFCSECGYKVTESKELSKVKESQKKENNDAIEGEYVIAEFSTYMFGLDGKSKNIVKNIDVSIPQKHYILTNLRIKFMKQGMISKKYDDVELFKIKDILIKQGMKEKLMGVGDIEIISNDESTPLLKIKRIKDPVEIKQKIRSAMIQAKKDMDISYRTNI